MTTGKQLSTYETAEWGARVAGLAQAHKDASGALFIDAVRVTTIDHSGHFSVLHCVDGKSRVVLTSFLRLVPVVALENAASPA